MGLVQKSYLKAVLNPVRTDFVPYTQRRVLNLTSPQENLLEKGRQKMRSPNSWQGWFYSMAPVLARRNQL